jgi:hypothetical protein
MAESIEICGAMQFTKRTGTKKPLAVHGTGGAIETRNYQSPVIGDFKHQG